MIKLTKSMIKSHRKAVRKPAMKKAVKKEAIKKRVDSKLANGHSEATGLKKKVQAKRRTSARAKGIRFIKRNGRIIPVRAK